MRVYFMQSGASNQNSSNMIERIRWRSGRDEIERDLAARGAEKPQRTIMVPNLKSHQDHLRGYQSSSVREAHSLLLSKYHYRFSFSAISNKHQRCMIVKQFNTLSG